MSAQMVRFSRNSTPSIRALQLGGIRALRCGNATILLLKEQEVFAILKKVQCSVSIT